MRPEVAVSYLAARFPLAEREDYGFSMTHHK
jgi:hypothetical protein